MSSDEARRRRWELPAIALPRDWTAAAKAGCVQAVAMAHYALVHVRSLGESSPLRHVRRATQIERLEVEVALLREELRIKDVRMSRIAPARRPQYPAAERLAILQLKAARAWSAEQAAREVLAHGDDDRGVERPARSRPDGAPADAEPVNRFPEFVAQIVQALKRVAPAMGKVRIAQMLARSGLHLGVSTVKRMLERRSVAPTPAPPRPRNSAADKGKAAAPTVTAKHATTSGTST